MPPLHGTSGSGAGTSTSIISGTSLPVGNHLTHWPSFLPFLMLLVFFLFIYFVTIRPQQKRQKEHEALVTSLEKGDEVMTSSGLVGKIENITDRYVSVKLNDQVSINMQKEFVASKLPKGTINSIESQ